MYNFKLIENLAQKRMNFNVKIEKNKPKYYVLEMFPYPSGNIHMGHLRNYTIGDVIARYKIACGYNVLHPIGWDAFGLPAENAALQNNLHPLDWTSKNIENMRQQLKSVGFLYDWSREMKTCSPEYYKHEQRFFLEFLKEGLAYKKESFVNWDPVDNTVLANEQVIDGRGWRSGAKVERKKLSQWFLKITDFSHDLLKELDNLPDWPARVRVMQNNWIGRSEGITIEFAIVNSKKTLKTFTTRAETIFGASFCAIACDHPITQGLTDQNIKSFIKTNTEITNEDLEKAEKIGIDTGIRVKHPFLKERILPVYIANFVLMEYGTGAVFSCPAHDKRDYDFAKKYELPIYPVIQAEKEGVKSYEIKEGVLFNSQFLDGLNVIGARKLACEKLVESGYGKKVINYRLRDWGISRQRYWGCPIPIIHCKKCGVVPVAESELPITLPEDVDFSKPGNPLANHPTWRYVKCPQCSQDALRETDTFDTFFESSWYFIAFCGLDKESSNYFLPVDCYIGGIEHAVLHLLYARFFTKALQKLGYVNNKEPFKKLITQGMICHETYKDKKGNFISPEEARQLQQNGEKVTVGRMEKMSKSKKNIVNPASIIDKYGADAVRLFMLSDVPPEKDLEWSSNGLDGAWRCVNRVYNLVDRYSNEGRVADKKLRKILHKCLYALTDDLEQCRLNCVVAKLHEMMNLLYSNDSILEEGLPILIRCIEPFIPHLADYLWKNLGNKNTISCAPWPVPDTTLLIDDLVIIALQINGRLRKTIEVPINSSKEDLESLALRALKERLCSNTIKRIIIVPNKIVNVVT